MTDVDPAADDAEQPDGGTSPAEFLMGFLAVAALAAGAYFAFKGLMPSEVKPKTNPNFIDNTFGSPFMVAVLRVIVLMAGAYVLVSLASHTFHGRLLEGIGPFKVSEATRAAVAMTDETSDLLRELEEQTQINAMLSERVQEHEDTIESLVDYVRHLQETLQVGDDPSDNA